MGGNNEQDSKAETEPVAKRAFSRGFLLTAIALLGLLILSSLAVIAVILSERQAESVTAQIVPGTAEAGGPGATATLATAATETATAEATAVPAAATAKLTVIATDAPAATVEEATPSRRVVPLASATPEATAVSGIGRVIMYPEVETGAHRIIRYLATLQGPGRIIDYGQARLEVEGAGERVTPSAEAPRGGSRIIRYGAGQ